MDSGLNGVEAMNIDVDSDMDMKIPEDVTIIDPDVETTEEAVVEPPRADDDEAMKKLLFPDDQNLEVDHETTFKWEITNWRKMERRSHSPTFMCGDYPWRILFFPFGNNCDCASFYLEHGFDDKPPEHWYQCVSFALVLWNPNDPTVFVQHQAHHRFTAEEADWGFTRFVELRELSTPNDKRPRPLVEGDSARLTAYVKIMKDPTGVLWHSFVNYDSKKETGYVGLKNQGATCYLNSLLQSLYFTNSFRKAVYKIPTENEGLQSSALTLQRLFYLLQTHGEAVGTIELTRSFGWETQDIFAQQDVQELNRILMENLENKMKGTEVENLLNKMFVGKTKTYIRCINVEYASERIEDFWDIQLNVRGYKNLDASFRNYIAEETMDGENKYFAEGHGLQDAKKGVIFESFPDVLHLHLKRFEYDLNTYAMQKVNDHYEFPETFDAAPYLAEDADKEAGWEYVLHGVLVHSGDLNAGHYYAFLRPEKDGQFLKFDDDRVTKATMREALDENFGGDYGVPDGVRNQYTRTLSAKRSMNAYMLVYLRKNKIDELLVPVTEADAPPHLKKRFDDERAFREQRKREREESHLYLHVRIISTKQFVAHQGFDLADWDNKDQPSEAAPIGYRFKRASTMKDLVEYVAEKHGCQPAQIRLWVMVNRQNKTIRPDQPILDLSRTVEETQVKHGKTNNDFRLWAEYMETPADIPEYVAPNTNLWIVIFLKHFDPFTESLRGVSHLYMRKNDKVGEVIAPINEKMGWPKGTEVSLFEEIKPTMIEPIKPKQSFHQAEIQDGDIICFQKALSDKETEELKEKKMPKDPKEFYDFLVNLTAVHFIPKIQSDHKGFTLSLSKKNTYDEVAEKVGAYLGVPGTHLRFMTVNSATGTARTPIKYGGSGKSLQQIFTGHYYHTSVSHNQLLYEVLDMPLAELETKRLIKFVWLPEGISKEEHVEALVPKNGTVADAVPYIQKRYNIDDSAAEKIRFFAAHAGKFHKDIPHVFNVAGIQEFMLLYAEIVPDEEHMANPEESRLIEAFHFQKEPSKPHTQGVPFQFLMKKGEKFTETRARLQTRTGIKGKPFEKIKFAVVQKSNYSKPMYLEDEDIIYDISDEGECLLGLDHVDRNGRNGWGRAGGPEIRIK